MSTYLCSKGHNSVESDYCSECGVKISGGIPDNSPPIASKPFSVKASSSQLCPDCAAPHESGSGNFCEICGYNFSTGGHGEVPIAIAPPPTVTESTTLRQNAEPTAIPTNHQPTPILAWELIVSVDPTLASAGSPPPPSDRAPITIRLEKTSNLIGRTSELRAIHPEIPLDYDDAVSSRHALINRQPDGSFVLRDIGSSNGTILNGIEIKSLVDIPLKDGDRFTLGHWTRIEVKAVRFL
jgi:hypothetical protein